MSFKGGIVTSFASKYVHPVYFRTSVTNSSTWQRRRESKRERENVREREREKERKERREREKERERKGERERE